MSDFLDDALSDQANKNNDNSEKPTEELLTRTTAAIERLAVRSTLQFIEGVNAGFGLVWNNEHGLTPEQVTEALGTNASAIFHRHAAVIQFLAGQSAETLRLVRMPPSDVTITHNQDGTVTLTRTGG